MARVHIPYTDLFDEKEPVLISLTPTTGDETNHHTFPVGENFILIAHNHKVAPTAQRSFSIIETADKALGRAAPQLVTLEINEIWIGGPYSSDGFAQPGTPSIGNLDVTAGSGVDGRLLFFCARLK